MKNRIIFLTVPIFVLISLSLQSFAQYEYQYNANNIICGNGACEHMSVKLKIGEEKSIDIGGKTYTFKLVNIENTPRQIPIVSATGEKIGENTEYDHKIYLSMNGGPSMLAEEAIRSLGAEFQIYADVPYLYKPSDTIVIQAYEDRFCAVPDCAFRVESNIYKKWNIVPLYFLDEKMLAKGACKPQDFTVINGYNPIKNDYVKLYSFGFSFNEFKSAVDNFQRSSESDRIWAGVPFNSVWVHSKSECKIVAELPNSFENLLLLIKKFSEQTVSRPYKQGETPPPPEKITVTFAPGWNFWTGSKDMQGKSFDEIKGNCNIEKAYTFDAQSGSWKKLETAPGPATNFIFKVTNKCMFGFPEIAPPEMPK